MKIHITLNYFQTKDFCNFKKKKLKNTFLTIATLTASILSCSAQENLPKVQTPDKKNYSYKIIVDSLDIPWGMSFINENDLLVKFTPNIIGSLAITKFLVSILRISFSILILKIPYLLSDNVLSYSYEG